MEGFWTGVGLPEGGAFGEGGRERVVVFVGVIEDEGGGVLEFSGGESDAGGATGDGLGVLGEFFADGDAEGGMAFCEGGGEVLGVVEKWGEGGVGFEEVEGEDVEVGGDEGVLALGVGGLLGDDVLRGVVVEEDVFEGVEVVGEGEGLW